MSIVDCNYNIPLIYATGYDKTFNTGANAPILASGIDMANKQKGDFVIKLRAGETMKDPSANMKELLAAFIATELEIPVAKPVIVDITQDFVETITLPSSKQLAEASLGLNFGSAYIDGYTTLLLKPLNDKELPFAQNMFVFDMLIQNIDRTIQKPNMLTNGTEIVAIDHEKAFSFIYTLFGPVNIWELPEIQKDWIRNHIFRPLIKGKRFDFDNFMNKCRRLDDNFWQQAWQLLPKDWRTDHFVTIKSKLDSFINNRTAFIQELQNIIS